MPTSRPPYLPVNPDIGYEHSDMNARRVVIAGAAILVGTWVFVSLLYFYYDLLARHRAATTPAVPARAAGQVVVPPEPRLEVSPPKDLAALRAAEDVQLDGYHWVDRQQGLVSIPIEQAMDLVARSGIPAQKAPTKYVIPLAGTRRTGLAGKVEPEPR